MGDSHLCSPVQPLVEVVQLPVHLGVGAAGEDCQGPEYSSVIAVQYSTVQDPPGDPPEVWRHQHPLPALVVDAQDQDSRHRGRSRQHHHSRVVHT